MHGTGAKQTVISTLIEYWKTHSRATAGHVWITEGNGIGWRLLAAVTPPPPRLTDTRSGGERDRLTLLQIWIHCMCRYWNHRCRRKLFWGENLSKVPRSQINAFVFGRGPGGWGAQPSSTLQRLRRLLPNKIGCLPRAPPWSLQSTLVFAPFI